MSDIACATLSLRGWDINDVPYNVGFTNVKRTQMTWNNINLRTLLGDLYDKYDTFNLCLSSISCGAPDENLGANYGANDMDNLQHLVTISGLPFLNQTYSQVNARNTNTAALAVFQYPSSTTTVGYRVYNNSGILTFGKSQEMCNITITLSRIQDGLDPNTNIAFPTTSFLFAINGIDKKSENGSRLDR